MIIRLLGYLLKILRETINAERKQMLYRGLYVNNETPKALGTKITWHK